MAAPGLGSRRPPRGVPDGGRDREGRRLGVGGVELMRERSMCGCDREADDRRGPIDVWLRSGQRRSGRAAGGVVHTNRCVAGIGGAMRPVPHQPADALVGPVGMRRCAAAERPANPARDRRDRCVAAICREGSIDAWLGSGGGRSAGTNRCVAAIWAAAIWAAAQGTRRGGRRPHQSMCGWNWGTMRPVPPQPAHALVGPVGMRRCAAAERPANPARDRRNGCMAAFCRPRLPTAVTI
jgi:hypothetical protein